MYQAVKPAGTGAVELRFLNPGTYYARLFIDSTPNGKWDTGNPTDSVLLQPEEVYYFAKKLELKKNWDVEQTWNIDELAIDVQKPYAIKKNNPFDRTGRNERRTGTTGGATGLRRNTF